MVNRALKPLISQSFFLFGARGTGKSTLVKERFGGNAHYLDLLQPELEDRLLRRPQDLLTLIGDDAPEWVIIDEVQKVPKLLDVVHSLIEETGQKFILTGSSARKLKRGGANLLAGRAFVYYLFPFVSYELDSPLALSEVLQFGSLPKVIALESTREKIAFLHAYSLTYIKEEVVAEQLLRNHDPFRTFLRLAADQSGKLVNHSSLARQVGVDHKTVLNYFSILEDTLIGFHLPSFHLSVRKSQIVAPKFYFFDLGVKNALAETIDLSPKSGTSFFGDLFEHFFILECFRANHYSEKNYRMAYLRTKGGFEIDLILSRGKENYFIEVKSALEIDHAEIERLRRSTADIKEVTATFYVSRDEAEITIEGVQCLHWQKFLQRMFFGG